MSTSHAVMELIEEISNATDNKKHAIGVFIDLKKGLRYIEPRTIKQLTCMELEMTGRKITSPTGSNWLK